MNETLEQITPAYSRIGEHESDTRPALPSWTEAINAKDNAPF